jgi:hypothetical protein
MQEANDEKMQHLTIQDEVAVGRRNRRTAVSAESYTPTDLNKRFMPLAFGFFLLLFFWFCKQML